jgi:hypothetical protein
MRVPTEAVKGKAGFERDDEIANERNNDRTSQRLITSAAESSRMAASLESGGR